MVFLKCGFKKTLKGGVLVISYILFTALFAITIANLNRAKLVKHRLENSVKIEEIQEKKPKSLEGKIRKWFE
jgi:hypothetical protein